MGRAGYQQGQGLEGPKEKVAGTEEKARGQRFLVTRRLRVRG